MTYINRWGIKKFILVVLTILSAMVGLVGLSALGFEIPIVRQIVGFIFLTFVPGILILRILKVHSISAVESLVYSVGLSLAFIMFTGLFMNFAFPLFGISKPISIFPLMVTFTGFILILGAIAYKRDKDFLTPSQSNSSPVFSPPYLFLILLPLLAILGALLVNYYQNNTLLLIFILVVAAIVGLVAFGKFIPERAYPLAIVMIAIALLCHVSLSSSFLFGYDIMAEWRYQNFVAQGGYWDSTIWGNVNTALSIVMLGPIYSTILNMEVVWIFKIIYPLFFCLVPVALFHIYREQIGSRRAFLSAFFFMSMMIFFILGSGRQQVAELFFALLILLMVDRKMTPLQKSALAIIFVMALPVSHYGIAYVSFAFFVIGWLLLILMRSKVVAYWWRNLTGRFSRSPASPGSAASTSERPPSPSILSGNLICLFIVCSIAWYMYTAGGGAIKSIVDIGQHIYSNIGEFFNPLARESLVLTATGADFTSVSTLGKSFRVFQYITQIFIIAGFIRLMLKPKGFKFRAEYIALTIVSALILFAVIVIPYFAGYFEVVRFYHVTLLLLAPLCILGGEVIWQGLSRLFKFSSLRLEFKGWLASPFNFSRPSSNYLGFLALGVLIPYFLFNTGFFFEVTGSELYNVVDSPSSEALSSYRMDMKVPNYREYAATEWLPGVVDDKTRIYADSWGHRQYNVTLYGRTHGFPLDIRLLPENFYVYLRTWNITKNEAVFLFRHGEQIKFRHRSFDAFPELSNLINNKNLIYNNGGAHVLGP